MCCFPWCQPSYTEQLLRELEENFEFTRYSNKNSWSFFPRKNGPVLKNFQWVTQGDIDIARSAQPNYRSGYGDQNHDFDEGQINFLVENNIRTVISFNSKYLNWDSHMALTRNNIEHRHFSVEDFTSLKIHEHSAIYDLIEHRKNLGGILFYCGYGQGRTGTGIAAYMMRYIMMHEPDIFADLSGNQLHSFVKKGFGVEERIQTQGIIDYLRSLATVEPAPRSIRARTLTEVSHMLFYDLYDEDDEFEPLPELPPIPPPKAEAHVLKKYPNFRPSNIAAIRPPKTSPKISSDPNRVSMQSLNPLGNVRNSLHDEFGSMPSVMSQQDRKSTLSQKFRSSEGFANPDSFYFSEFDI